MTEFFCGLAVGTIITGTVALFECHRHKTKRVVQLEKEYALLEQHVRKAVASIDTIIHGSKP